MLNLTALDANKPGLALPSKESSGRPGRKFQFCSQNALRQSKQRIAGKENARFAIRALIGSALRPCDFHSDPAGPLQNVGTCV